MIELTGISKHFGKNKAVDNISLTVPTGELFCFLGPNGAGKTTTIKMMTSLLRPTSGTIKLHGIDISKDPIAAKKITGYIPDMPFLYDRLTTSEYFEFIGDLYAIPHDLIWQRYEELFRTFNLMDIRHHLIKDLSHGMKQRLIYAATLLHEPKILFIDEPLIGLDPYTIRLIKDLLREKARSGTTIFLTTHILALAQDIADRIAIILNGKVIALGNVSQLKGMADNAKDLEDAFLKLTADDVTIEGRG